MKKIYKENRVIFILGIITIVCIIISTALLFKYFYFGNGQTKYGDRLDEIENIPISDTFKEEFISILKENKLVKDAEILVTGKIIYITLKFADNVSLVEAQSIALASVEQFSDEEKSVYDLSFTLIEEESENNEGFTIMGAMNAGRPKIEWNNNNPVTSEATEESE